GSSATAWRSSATGPASTATPSPSDARPGRKEAAMQQLGSRSFELEGARALEDSHDSSQWWYVATRVELGKAPDGSPDITFIEYEPAAVAAGGEGGGDI